MATPTAFETIVHINTKNALNRIFIDKEAFETLNNRNLSQYEKFKPAAPKLEDFTVSEFPVNGGKVVLYSYKVADKSFSIVVSLQGSGKAEAIVLADELGFTNHEKHDDLVLQFQSELTCTCTPTHMTCVEMIFHSVKNAFFLVKIGEPYVQCYNGVNQKLFSAKTPRDMQKATSAASIPKQFFLAEEWAAVCAQGMFRSMLTAAIYSKSFYGKFAMVAELLKSHGVDLDKDVRVVECRDKADGVWGIFAKSDDLLESLVGMFKAGDSPSLTGFIDTMVAEKKACNNFGLAATPFLAAVGKTRDFSDFCSQAELYQIIFEVEEDAEDDSTHEDIPTTPKRKLDDMDAETLDDEPAGRDGRVLSCM